MSGEERRKSAVADRLVAAALAMRADGWWWHEPAATASIRRQVLGEMLAARVPGLVGSVMPAGRSRSGRGSPSQHLNR